jgi:tetratricopeptide (TPR) repeat protein
MITLHTRSGEDYADLQPADPAHFVFGKEIARGGMGRIRLARDRRLGRPVAIKELLHNSPHLRARFEREARITAKLQHPAIVNILEAGEWPSGEPFYVMKLVTGETFDRVIARCTNLEQRLGLLASVIAMVDALAYAHSKNVIHRDLKPQNILVGEFGETVVIDWGIAKDLSDPGGVDTAGSDQIPAAPEGTTVAGSVLGTPAYMPPEQALGRVVDARADVYALGAILYHALVGAPAFSFSDSTDETLRRVVEDGPPSIASRAPGVPRDLVTIVEKAMARDPAERYPTAQELVVDLKKFQTGQLVGSHEYSAWQLLMRWARAHRTALGVAGVALVVLAVLGGLGLRRIFAEQRESERLGKIAERRRGQAEELLSFMLGDLRDKLLPLGKLDVLEDVANKAVTYFDDTTQLSDGDLALRAETQRQLGDVLLRQGHTAGARRVLADAMTLAKALAGRDPTNLARQFDLAASHHLMGVVASASGETGSALVEYRAERAILERLTKQDAANVPWQRALSVSDQAIGAMLSDLGDTAGALVAFRESAAVRTALSAKEPASAERLRDLANIQIEIGETLLLQNDPRGALVEFRAVLASAEQQVARDPRNASWQTLLARGHQRVGEGIDAMDDIPGALVELRAALAIYERLAESDPSDMSKQASVAYAHQQIGLRLLVLADAEAATAAFRRALAIAEVLAVRDPSNADRKATVGLIQRRLGQGLGLLGDQKGALEITQKALSTSLVLLKDDPENVEKQRSVASARGAVAEILAAGGDLTRSIAEYKGSIEITQAIADRDPTNFAKRYDVAVWRMKLAEAELKHGDVELALAELRASRVIFEAQLAHNPTNPSRLFDLTIVLQRIGDVLMQNQGNPAAALVELRQTVVLATALVEKGPKVPDYLSLLSDAHEAVGDALFAQGDRASAIASYKTALELAQQLLAVDPKYEGVAENNVLLRRKIAGR